MKKTLLIFALASLSAVAGPITPSGWYGFAWGQSGTTYGAETSAAITPIAYPGDSPWTFTLAEATPFSVVDGYLIGDQFEVFNFGSSIGTSSTPGISGACSPGEDPIYCASSPGFSVFSTLLAPGSYELSIQTIVFAPETSSGGAWFGFEDVSPAAIPEPATTALIGFGGVALWLFRRRK